MPASPSPGQLASRAACGDGRQAMFGVAAVLFQVQAHHRVDPGSLLGVEVAARQEMLGERALAGSRPRLKRRHELALVDQAVLKRQHAEEQVTAQAVIDRVSTRAVENRLQAVSPDWSALRAGRGPRSGSIDRDRDKNSGAIRTASRNLLYWRMLQVS